MQNNNQVILKGESYSLLLCEKENIFHPQELGIMPVWPKTAGTDSVSVYEIDDYRLYLRDCNISFEGSFPDIQGVSPAPAEGGTVKYEGLHYFLNFSGAVIIARDKQIEEENSGLLSCYGYHKVLELIFRCGVLVTTIDHSRSMRRIRKNIEKGLRNMSVKRDIRCVKKFIRSSFVGKYKKGIRKKFWKKQK